MAMQASPESRYHRWLGYHAPSMRRVLITAAIGLLVMLLLLPWVTWGLAVVIGWDAASLAFLASLWPIIVRADGSQVQHLATREDETRGSATVLLLGASVGSLIGVIYTVHLAGVGSGTTRDLLISAGVLTVLLSWAVVNSVFTLRYAHLYYRSPAKGIDFENVDGAERATYIDFAYIAFTIGMCYQVSDTNVRNPRIRGTVLWHALLSYLFGVVIIGGSVNLIAGLIR
jgi:uncharacterized membrane protein